MPQQGFGIGAAFSSISDRLFDLEEARQKQYQQNVDYQLAQLRYQELTGRLKLLNLDLAAAALYSPAEEALLKRDRDRLANQASEAEYEIKQLDMQRKEIEVDIAEQTRGAEITKTFNEARRSGFDAQKSQQDLLQAILNRQQDQIDAIVPDKETMQEIASLSPSLASSINSLAAIGRSQLYVGTDPQTGMSREVEFQRLLTDLNDLLYLDVDNDLREAFDLPPGEKVDVVALSQMRMGRQADATRATELMHGIFELQRQEMDAEILDSKGQQAKGKPPSQFLQIAESFGGTEALGQLNVQVTGDYLGAFLSPEANQFINASKAEAVARAAQQEALNRVEGVESPLWKGIKEQGAKIWKDTGDLYLQDVPALLFGDDQDKLDIFEGQDERDTLDMIQESAPEIPGLSYNSSPVSWMTGGPGSKFDLQGFTGDTGISKLYDPTQDAVVDVDKGYGYQLNDSLRMKLEYMLEPGQWEAIQALPPDRRRAVEAHLAVSLPGSPNLFPFISNTLTPFGMLNDATGMGSSSWKRGIYRENGDDASVRNLLFEAAIARGTGPALKAIGKVGGKVASPVVNGLRRLFGKGGAEAVAQTLDDAARMAEPPPMPGEIGPHSPANFWHAMSEGKITGGRTGMQRAAASGNYPQPQQLLANPNTQFQMGGSDWGASGNSPEAIRAAFRAAGQKMNAAQMPVPYNPMGGGLQGLVEAASGRPPIPLQGGFQPGAAMQKAMPQELPMLPGSAFSRQPTLVDYTGPVGPKNMTERGLAANNLLQRLAGLLEEDAAALAKANKKPRGAKITKGLSQRDVNKYRKDAEGDVLDRLVQQAYKSPKKGMSSGKSRSVKLKSGKTANVPSDKNVAWTGAEGGPLKRYFNPATGEFLQLPEGAAKLYKDELIDLSALPKDLPGLKNLGGE